MSVLLRPVVTEKANSASEMQNKYTFVVGKSFNKIEIKKAVELQYSVSVESVKVLNVSPKRFSKYTKKGIMKGKSNAEKRAIVKIAEGENIDFYSKL